MSREALQQIADKYNVTVEDILNGIADNIEKACESPRSTIWLQEDATAEEKVDGFFAQVKRKLEESAK